MENKVYGEIYGLFFPNGSYIGQTIQGEKKRWNEHLRDTNACSNLPVHNAIRKYYDKDPTKNKVKRVILAQAYSLEELNILETKYIVEYNTFNDNGKNPNGYNMTMGGDGCKGYKFTKKQKENQKIIQQKRKEERPEIPINHSKFMKQRAIDNPNIGMQHSINMKQLYSNNPEKKKEMSTLKIRQNIDNPEMAKQQSELKLMRYEDKNAFELITILSEKSKQQWQDPEKRKKIMDEKRNRFSKSFNVYKDGILIDSFNYVPDCAFKMFGKKTDSKISAALNGKIQKHKGYVFKYTEL
jgi:hypothetical protein